MLTPPDYATYDCQSLFYFKSDHLYGLGSIERAWVSSSGGKQTVELSFRLYVQPDGSTNIE